MYWKNPVRLWREKEKRYRFLGARGKLLSWSEIYQPPRSFEGKGRYVVGVVDLGSGGRVVGQLVAGGELRAGVEVEGVLRRLWEDGDEGVIGYGVKWKVVGKAGV